MDALPDDGPEAAAVKAEMEAHLAADSFTTELKAQDLVPDVRDALLLLYSCSATQAVNSP